MKLFELAIIFTAGTICSTVAAVTGNTLAAVALLVWTCFVLVWFAGLKERTARPAIKSTPTPSPK